MEFLEREILDYKLSPNLTVKAVFSRKFNTGAIEVIVPNDHQTLSLIKEEKCTSFITREEYLVKTNTQFN